jgi:Cu/Ag efflux pump CusA
VPLSALAKIYEDRGPNYVSRENVQRKIVVMCNVAERDLRGVIDDVQRHVRSEVTLPAGYRVEYGGQFESEASASRRLSWLGIASVLAILLILATALKSFRDSLIIMLNLPLALIGGVVGVFLSEVSCRASSSGSSLCLASRRETGLCWFHTSSISCRRKVLRTSESGTQGAEGGWHRS